MLTSDEEISTAAQLVGISVQSFDQFASSLNEPDTNPASWGDVESEFGVRSTSKTASRNGHVKSDDNTVVESDLKETGEEHTPKMQESEESAAISVDASKAQENESTSLEGHQEEVAEFQEELRSKKVAPSQGQANGVLEEQTKAVEGIETGDDGKVLAQPTQPAQVEVLLAKPRAWADVVSNRMRPIEERYPSPTPGTAELSESTKLDPEAPGDSQVEQVNQEKASNIADWVRMVSQASMETEPTPITKGSHRKRSPRNKKEKASPPEQPAKPFRPILMQRTPKSSHAASDQAHTVSDKARTPSPPPLAPAPEQIQSTAEATSTDKTVEAKPVSLHRSTNSSASSGQTAPSKDTSLPKSAPVDEPEDSEEEVVVFNPRAKRLSAQQQVPQPSAEEKPSHSKQLSNGKIFHTKHLSLEEPSKIQPSIPGKAMPAKQHRPPKPRAAPVVIDPDAFGRDFASNPQMNQQNGFRTHQRPSSQHGPPRLVSQHGPPRGGARGGRPFIHPQALTALQNGQHSHANSNGRGSHQNRMPPATTNGQSNYVTTNQNSVAVNGQAALRPSPRPSPRVSPQHLPQTIATEPDVDFVLQSGPPRGSTRGRGKLWIP